MLMGTEGTEGKMKVLLLGPKDPFPPGIWEVGNYTSNGTSFE